MGFRITSFDDAVARIEAFKIYLDSLGASVHPSSRLASDIRLARRILKMYHEHSIEPNFDEYSNMGRFTALHWLAERFLRIQGGPLASSIGPFFRRLSSGDQNHLYVGAQSQDRNYLFEAICAEAATQFSGEVNLGVEPDVLCRFRGNAWGLACKVIYSGKSAAKAILEGMDQILRSGAEYGFVVVDLTNVFPHRAMFDLDPETNEVTALRYPEANAARFGGLLAKTVRPIEQRALRLLSRSSMAGNPGLRGVIYVARTACFSMQVRTVLAILSYGPLGKIYVQDEWDFVDRFNRAMQ